MRIKMFNSWSNKALEYNVNHFLKENDGKIEVIEIKWRGIFEHYVMITYKEIVK